ncbi:hypothetical protein GGS23DRAFT_373711 [Durotheca rogersii]|uniref:uncharacterized protein n=2 Tax=Durotheca rogersii TaxID=419775 RepID=UPI00221E8B89|nr:uncharacterized protein GGS23DRAFT_373711 [Durotheca rogersii]KAI5866188.1 hypothetical protein GGS23DRAFT_373711 [Durotheca rogersii]
MAAIGYDEVAVMDEDVKGDSHGRGIRILERSSLSRTRSLSDGGATPLSSSPHILEASRRASKDDSSLIMDRSQDAAATAASAAPAPPVTPRRPDISFRGLSLQISNADFASPAQTPSHAKLAPLSPKLDHSQIYASPTNILPRRSRGLDFSRAATSLHHSTLAEQSSPDSSPTIGGRAMNIPSRSSGEYGLEQPVTSLWSMMGNQERMHVSSSVGSANPLASDSSSGSDDDDPMDDEMEDAIFSTPQAVRANPHGGVLSSGTAAPWMTAASSTISSLSSFRTRPRRQPRRKTRGLTGLPFSPAHPAALSKSPPNNVVKDFRDVTIPPSRRESISWAANQLHISGSESEDRSMDSGEALSRDGHRGVIKRAVTRRGNLLPKTKGFARIRAALAEESAPIDSEVRREAEVIRQVRESDMDLEPRVTPAAPLALDTSNISTTRSSPNPTTAQESLDDIPEDDMMTDSSASNNFKQQAVKNSKGKNFWETFSETSSARVTPPPPSIMPRGSSSGMSEDVNMDSPSLSAGSGSASLFGLGPGSGQVTRGPGSDGQKSETPQPTSVSVSQGGNIPPTAAEITRRINNKRRRDDDFDPHSFKRRAVSPGMSVHNSPIMQSPLQRDMAPWGSRPGSNHGGDRAPGTPSENGSSGGNNGPFGSSGRSVSGAKGRVGFQGMVDTNDGLMRMSIE